ncbi:MAG: hypothetical protein HQ510_07305 [Candidatus Marinimicrobia bacterium]|nr:hypothetical protein [Candidatus Neomarinimicrobiota bacterium]
MTSLEEILKKQPLVVFSIYTHIQVQFLERYGNELCESLDKMLAEKHVISGDIQLTYGQIWLWILGAYEVVRTMCQAKACFSDALFDRLIFFKRDIANFRIPFAKQELRGRNIAVHSELSISGYDFVKKDFVFTIDNKKYSFRDYFINFSNLMASITNNDIIHGLEKTYE